MVDWEDHTADGGWIDKPEDINAEVCQSIGWLIAEDDKQIKIANAVTKDSGIGGVQVILKSCIVELYELDLND
jgi:hypothetical protein